MPSALGIVLAMAFTSADAPSWVYIGTYTGTGSEGIYRAEFDPATGALSKPVLAAETTNPSFLALHPSGQFLYAVNEVVDYEGEETGSVSAYALDPKTGALTFLNRVSSKGGAPCHVTVDATGHAALVANYGGGSVASLPIEDDGRLGPAASAIQHEGKGFDPRRQEGPHGHSINLGPSNTLAVAADLGLDKLLLYDLDPETAKLTPHDPPSTSVNPGSGPRHFAFHPDGTHAYVINEMASTITTLNFDAEEGTLTPVQTITTLPAGFDGNNSTADIHVRPDGKFVYGSNRGHNSIAIFRADPTDGTLAAVGHHPTGGKTPRNFAVDPSGRFLLAANQDSDDIFVFPIDPEAGTLGDSVSKATASKPVCLLFVPRPE